MVRAFSAEVEARGITDYRAHGLSRPPITEALATAEVYELGVATGCPVHIVHCSIGRGYELAAAYRSQGHAATIEACIHYLTLDEENDVRRLIGKAKINPPLRSRREVDALWHHLAAGNVTVVSTDHVSWSEDRKSDPNMLKNASGVPGLEALYALLLKGLDERGLPLTHAARLLAHNPAALFRIAHRKGALELGRDADIVLMRRDPHRYRASESGNNFVSWSPYDGIELPFRPVATFLRGECVFADGRVIAEPGCGRFVQPRLPAH
jgi:allantoinase